MRLVLPLFMLALHLLWWSPAAAQHPLLRDIVAQRNLAELQKSLKEGSYKGEEGILRIRPEAAKSLGLKVFVDSDYLDAGELLEQAASSLEAAKGFMATGDEETYLGEHIRNIGILYLHYRRSLERAKQKLLSYHAKLDPGTDERLYAQDRRELLQSSNDERLDASLAMEYGLKYFLRLMKEYKGDMSLALAAYNAGPQRIKE